ncbi:MAG: hypothetical protein OEU93_03220 [Rubrivivax sp.]|nr:hypothetical protein [Rubrivivax sp.]
MVLKARVPCWIGFLAMWPAMPTAADKQGFYIGAGISAATYRISTDLDSGMKGSRVAGGRLEAGHVWDVGRAGGFRLGVAVAYDHWGEAEDTRVDYHGTVRETFRARFVAVNCVLQQEIAPWVDFVFKAGPGFGSFDARREYLEPVHPYPPESSSGEGLGGSYIAGFDFFPVPHLVLEIAGQVNWFTPGGSYFLDAVGVAALSGSLQYRF